MLESPKPVAAANRYHTLDVLRGFALLGILGPNIITFAWPSVAMTSHEIMGETTANRIGHDIIDVFFLGKMMFNFAMLFGAGVILFDRKFTGDAVCGSCGYDVSTLDEHASCPECGAGSERRRPAILKGGAGLWYTRCAWLLLLGILHAVGLWFGDILVWYAVSGLLSLWWIRRLSAGKLFAVAAVLYPIGAALLFGFSYLGVWAVEAGHANAEDLVGSKAGEITGYTGSYLDALMARLPTLIFLWLLMVPIFSIAITGIMSLGMALMKSGFLTGERSTRLYATLAVIGLPVGIGGTLATMFGFEQLFGELSGFAFQGIAQFVGVPTAIGYAALVILITKNGWLRPVTSALANVGRMALSNYFSQTIICTTLFYGYGFGLYGKVGYPELFYIMFGVWAFNIAFSAVWLRYFRFGPAEWAWRSMTYLKLQPMRK